MPSPARDDVQKGDGSLGNPWVVPFVFPVTLKEKGYYVFSPMQTWGEPSSSEDLHARDAALRAVKYGDPWLKIARYEVLTDDLLARLQSALDELGRKDAYAIEQYERAELVEEERDEVVENLERREYGFARQLHEIGERAERAEARNAKWGVITRGAVEELLNRPDLGRPEIARRVLLAGVSL